MATFNSDDLLSFGYKPEEKRFDPNTLIPEEEREDKFDSSDLLSFGQEEESADVPDVFKPQKPRQYGDDIDIDTAEELSFQELASDEDYTSMLSEYMVDRLGEDGKQQADETNEDYLKRFLTHTREFEWNSIDLASQLNWVRGADEEKRMKFGYLYSQLEKLPSFYEEGGTGYLSAMRDFGKSLLLDPLTYLGFGAGKVAATVGQRAIVQALKTGGKKLALEEAAKYSGKRLLSTTGGRIATAGVAIEGGAAGVQDLKMQEIEKLSWKYGEPEEGYDYVKALVTGGIGAGMGVIGLKLSGGVQGDRLLTNARQARIKQKKIANGLNIREKALRDEAAKQAGLRTDEVVNQSGDVANNIFDKDAGRQVLEELGPEPADPAAQMQFRTDLMVRVGKAVTTIVEDLAATGQLGKMVNEETTASEVIGKIVADSLKISKGKSAKEIREQTERMLKGTDTEKGVLDLIEGEIDENVLESAISQAGLTPKQFVDAMGASYQDAGRYLQTASNVGKIIKGIARVDKELADALVEQVDSDKMVGILGKGHQFMQRLDRERRALMVTQISTTVRNVGTALIRLPMEAAANAIEASLYHIGRGADAAMTGNMKAGTFSGFRDIIRDSFGAINRLRDLNATTDLAEALLRHNSSLASRMDRTLQEVDTDQTLSWVTRKLNGLNMAQDIIFRRAIFTDTIDKRMRRAGIIVDNPTKIGQYKSLEEFVSSGKVLPSSVLADAVDEALAFTFSRMPKANKGKAGDTIGHYFIKINETLGPIPGLVGTAAFPFARFMVNALQFQFEYSPTSVVSSAYRTVYGKYARRAAEAAKKAGNLDLATAKGKEADALLNRARADFSKGVVGTAALMAAINYRAKNQDVKWYEGKAEEGTYDLRPFFPIAPYLAVADLIVKVGNDSPIDTKDFIEGFTGAQWRTGASSFVVDNFFELVKGEVKSSARIGEITGQYVGELFGGFATPLRVVRDVEAAFDTEAAIVRDSKQMEGIGGFGDRFQQALANTVKKDLPGYAKELPALESPTREGPVIRQSPMIGQFTGLRKEAPRNPAEIELVRLGYKSFEIAPSSGDKKADAFVKQFLGGEIERSLSAYVQSDAYLSKTEPEKKLAIRNRLKFYRSRAKTLGKIEARKVSDTSYTPFDRAEYNRLPSLEREAADEWYMQKYGKSVIEMQELEPDKNHLKVAIAVGRALSKNTE